MPMGSCGTRSSASEVMQILDERSRFVVDDFNIDGEVSKIRILLV